MHAWPFSPERSDKNGDQPILELHANVELDLTVCVCVHWSQKPNACSNFTYVLRHML